MKVWVWPQTHALATLFTRLTKLQPVLVLLTSVLAPVSSSSHLRRVCGYDICECEHAGRHVRRKKKAYRQKGLSTSRHGGHMGVCVCLPRWHPHRWHEQMGGSRGQTSHTGVPTGGMSRWASRGAGLIFNFRCPVTGCSRS